MFYKNKHREQNEQKGPRRLVRLSEGAAHAAIRSTANNLQRKASKPANEYASFTSSGSFEPSETLITRRGEYPVAYNRKRDDVKYQNEPLTPVIEQIVADDAVPTFSFEREQRAEDSHDVAKTAIVPAFDEEKHNLGISAGVRLDLGAQDSNLETRSAISDPGQAILPRFEQPVDQQKQNIDRLILELGSAQHKNKTLREKLDLKSERLDVAQQAVENHKIKVYNASLKLESTREEVIRLTESNKREAKRVKELNQLLEGSKQQLSKLADVQANERQQHAQEIKELNQLLEDSKKQLAEVLQLQDNDRWQYTQKTNELERLLKSTKQELAEVLQTQADERRQHSQMIDKRDELLNNTKQQLTKLEQNLDDERQRHAQDLSILQQENHHITVEADKKLNFWMLNQKKEVDRLNRDMELEISQRVQKHNDETVALQQKLEDATVEAEEKRQTLKAVLIQEYEKEISGIKSEMLQQQQDEELKLLHLIKAHEAELAEEASYHERATRQIRDDLQKVNAALLTRDDQQYQGELFTTSGLPAKPDEQMRIRFLDIEDIVDRLGRLDWKQEPAVWTMEVLQDLKSNGRDRILKKAIVQDLIWCFLYHHIFCSPFRVFGTEGKLLEKEWNEQCGQGLEVNEEIYRWPDPDIKTERWRYMTVKECREVLQRPVPGEWDPRARLRKGFINNLQELGSTLRALLEKITCLTTSDAQMIDRLTKKAATIWLDFAMHRCRIVVRLKGPALLSMEEKVVTAQTKSLELTVMPTVGRYGNVMGVDLDRYKTIDGCDGKSMVVPG